MCGYELNTIRKHTLPIAQYGMQSVGYEQPAESY